LVLVGKWNKYILVPDWVGTNIFKQKTVQVEFPLNLQGPPRFTNDEGDIRMLPDDDRVIFVAVKNDEAILKKIEQMANDLLSILPYTPISSFGENFGFIEETNLERILPLFEFPDNDSLSRKGCAIGKSSIRRTISKYPNTVLNFVMKQDGPKVIFDFNFHYLVKDAKEALEKITGSFIENKRRSEEFLREIYGLEYETEEEHDD